MPKKEGFDFDRPINRRNTDSLKWDLFKEPEAISMWLADMDFYSPPQVREALHNQVDHGVFGYTLPPRELKQEIASLLLKQYHSKIQTDWIVWLPGLVTGLNVACRTAGGQGDDVLTTVPVYPPFLSAPGYSDRNLVTVPLMDTGKKWIIDFNRLEDAFTDRTRLFMLCNPHNPVGKMYTEKELSTLAAICEKRDIIICSDEIHCDLILSKEKRHFPTAATFPAMAEQTITLMAPSKTFNLPGLGCAFAIIPSSDLRGRFKKEKAGIVPEVNMLGYTAAQAAYRYGWPWLSELLDYLRNNHAILKSYINKIPGLSMTDVEATYLAWLNTSETGITDPASFFKKAGVILSAGKDFTVPGSPGMEYLRLNFACPKSMLIEALVRMSRALK